MQSNRPVEDFADREYAAIRAMTELGKDAPREALIKRAIEIYADIKKNGRPKS